MDKDDCIFCRIIAGEAEVSTVYENDLVIAFMTLEQPSGYHVIVVPKEHVTTLYDLSDEQASAIMITARNIARATRLASKCEGLNLYQANGELAGQDVFHFHLHIIPRFEGDKVSFDWDTTFSPRHVLDKMASEIRDCLPISD